MNVHAPDTVLPRNPLFRGADKGIEILGNANGCEANRLQYEQELCLRQSAGDSTSPEIDVAPDRLGEFVGHDNVGIEKLAAGSENPEHLAERLALIGRQI